jgi:hypothetical protein
MAGQSRTLKLSILADVDQLKKSLAQANGDVDNSSSKMSEFGKKAGMAFAAAGAAAATYAIKIGIDGVKAALDDEKAQRILALTLENTTGATKKQIAAVEDYILQTSLAVGVTDDKLRPAFARLVRSTKDTEEAQKLLNLSLDIASATGKPLEAIANSLGKAYDGNTQALGKLGLGIDQSILKTKDFNLVYESLRTSFKGFAEGEAETFQGRLARLQVAFDEAKETIGFKLLPIIQKLVEFVVNEVVPALGKFAQFFKPITDAISANKEEFATFIAFIQKYVVPVLVNVLGGAFKVVGEIAGGVINVIGAVVGGLNTLIAGAVAGINALIRVYNSIPFLPNVGLISAPSINVPSVSVPSVGATTALPKVVVPSVSAGSGSGSSGGGGGGGGIAAAMSGAASASGTSFSTALTQSAAIRRAELATGSTINVTVNGAIDSEGTARTIVNTLNDSFFRGTGGGDNILAIA